MKCLLCKTTDLVCSDRNSEVKLRQWFCEPCFWNSNNTDDDLALIVTKYKEQEKNQIKFPEAKDYPNGYNWFAYDENGVGWFYMLKPSVKGIYWHSEIATKKAYSFVNKRTVSNWKDTLRKRKPVDTNDTNQINPDYYKWHPITECVNIIQEFPTNLGMAIKYLWRVASPTARKFDSKEERIQDLKKAIRCIEFEIERIKAE